VNGWLRLAAGFGHGVSQIADITPELVM